jgi:hypothetical protein
MNTSGMGWALALALGIAVATPITASAQIDWQAQRADAGYVADVGMGLTIAGLATVGAGTGLFFGLRDPDGAIGFGGIIGGGVLWGIGGLLALAGIPTWIAGAVRACIADAGDTRASVASTWEHAGLAVFFASLALSALGATLMGAGIGAQDTGLSIAGVSMIPIGVFAAAFIGAPMWAEGARF